MVCTAAWRLYWDCKGKYKDDFLENTLNADVYVNILKFKFVPVSVALFPVNPNNLSKTIWWISWGGWWIIHLSIVIINNKVDNKKKCR